VISPVGLRPFHSLANDSGWSIQAYVGHRPLDGLAKQGNLGVVRAVDSHWVEVARVYGGKCWH